MKQGIRHYFMQRLKDPSIIVRRKAALLVTMNLAVMLMVLPVSPVVYLTRGDYLRPLSLALPVIASCSLSLLFLRLGRYHLAANITALGATATILAGITVQHMGTPTLGFSSMVHMSAAVIVFSSLFCGILTTSIVVGILFSASVALFFFLRSMGMVEPPVVITGLVDNSIGIFITFAVAVLITRLSRDALTEVKRESDKSRERYLSIRDLLESVSSVSHDLATTAEEMSTATVSLSENAQGQAASSEEITSAMEEVNAAMEVQAENVNGQFRSLETLIEKIDALSKSVIRMGEMIAEAMRLSEETSRQSGEGERTLDLMNRAMGAISERSQQMTMVVDVINSISDQISLLSLNAAIEAARAGDAGRGFAVVADEISKLAVQTGDSLKEISQLISSTEEEVGRGLTNVQGAVDVMRSTIRNVNDIGEGMKRIHDIMREQVELNRIVHEQSKSVREKSEEINISTGEQQTAISEVSRSIAVINEATQSIAGASEELMGTSRTLAGNAELLKSKLGTVEIDGDSSEE